MSDEVFEQVRAIIAKEIKLDPADITRETSMETLELWDSVAHVEIIFAIEEKFSVELSQEETEEMYSVAEILDVLAKKSAS